MTIRHVCVFRSLASLHGQSSLTACEFFHPPPSGLATCAPSLRLCRSDGFSGTLAKFPRNPRTSLLRLVPARVTAQCPALLRVIGSGPAAIPSQHLRTVLAGTTLWPESNASPNSPNPAEATAPTEELPSQTCLRLQKPSPKRKTRAHSLGQSESPFPARSALFPNAFV